MTPTTDTPSTTATAPAPLTLTDRTKLEGGILAGHGTLAGEVDRSHARTQAARVAYDTAASSPVWRSEHATADLGALRADLDAALIAEGIAIKALTAFERQHGNRAAIEARVKDLEAERMRAAMNAAVQEYKSKLRELLMHLHALRHICPALDDIAYRAERKYGITRNPIHRTGLSPDFYFDRDFPTSNQARTPLAQAVIGIGTWYPDLIAADDPLTPAIRSARETWGLDRK